MNNLEIGQKVSNPKLRNETKIRQKVSNLIGGQKCRKGRRAVMPLKTTGSRQKVCKHVSMVGLAPGRERRWNKGQKTCWPPLRPQNQPSVPS